MINNPDTYTYHVHIICYIASNLNNSSCVNSTSVSFAEPSNNRSLVRAGGMNNHVAQLTTKYICGVKCPELHLQLPPGHFKLLYRSSMTLCQANKNHQHLVLFPAILMMERRVHSQIKCFKYTTYIYQVLAQVNRNQIFDLLITGRLQID